MDQVRSAHSEHEQEVPPESVCHRRGQIQQNDPLRQNHQQQHHENQHVQVSMRLSAIDLLGESFTLLQLSQRIILQMLLRNLDTTSWM